MAGAQVRQGIPIPVIGDLEKAWQARVGDRARERDRDREREREREKERNGEKKRKKREADEGEIGGKIDTYEREQNT